MEAALTLWCTHEVCQPDSELLRGIALQSGSRRAVERDVCVNLSVPLSYHEICYKPEKKQDPVTLWLQLDDLDFADDLALLSQPLADAGKKHLTCTMPNMQHLFAESLTGNYQQHLTSTFRCEQPKENST